VCVRWHEYTALGHFFCGALRDKCDVQPLPLALVEGSMAANDASG
jgi:hypothetical protein